ATPPPWSRPPGPARRPAAPAARGGAARAGARARRGRPAWPPRGRRGAPRPPPAPGRSPPARRPRGARGGGTWPRRPSRRPSAPGTPAPSTPTSPPSPLQCWTGTPRLANQRLALGAVLADAGGAQGVKGPLAVVRLDVHRPGGVGEDHHLVAGRPGVPGGRLHAVVEGQPDHHHPPDAPV